MLFKWIILLLTAVIIHSAPLTTTSQLSDINFRLPNNTVPEHYIISLRTWIHEGNFTFVGIVTIDVRPTEPTDFITIHQEGFIINNIDLSSDEGSIPIEPFEYNSTLDFLTVPTSVNLNPRQRYSLRIEYVGTLRDDDLGFYRSSYVNDAGSTVWLAVTNHCYLMNIKHLRLFHLYNRLRNSKLVRRGEHFLVMTSPVCSFMQVYFDYYKYCSLHTNRTKGYCSS